MFGFLATEMHCYVLCVCTSWKRLGIKVDKDAEVKSFCTLNSWMSLWFSRLSFGLINPVSLYIGFVVLNATFNNISCISWRSVLLVEEIGVPVENHRPVASHWQTLSYNVASSTPRLSGIRTPESCSYMQFILW